MKKFILVWLFLVIVFGLMCRAGGAFENSFIQTIEYAPETLAKNARVSVSVELPPEHIFTEGMPLQYEIRLRDVKAAHAKVLKKDKFENPAQKLPLEFKLGNHNSGDFILEINLHVPYCSLMPPKLCKFKTLELIQPVTFSAEGKDALNLDAVINPSKTV